ncbi:MAG TPA: hypothetical protein VGA16_06335 [Candidatus Limnocylindria bacterium]
MATLALPRRREWDGAAVLGAVLLIGVVGLFSDLVGTAWDVAWHRTVGRDSFWIAPHLWTYAGVALNGIAAIVATTTAMGGRRVHGRELRVGPLRAELGLALAGTGSAVIIAAAPFDDMWHRTFGPDVDIWSPPHMAAIAVGGPLVYLGWALALVPGVFPIADVLRRFLRIGMFGALVGTAIFAMNFYYFAGVTREAFFYPLLVCATIPFILAAADALMNERAGATKVALWYTVVALAVFGALQIAHWRPPAFPPLIAAGAIAVDIARRRGASPLVIAAAFAVAFVGAEWVRMLLFPAPVPASIFTATDRGARLFVQYYEHALARPWTSAWPLAGMAAGIAAAWLSWVAGAWIGRKVRLAAERPSAVRSLLLSPV